MASEANSSAEQPVESPIIHILEEIRESKKPVKTSWPELKGRTASEAEKKIKEEMPDVHVCRINAGDAMTLDYRTDRVRLVVGSSGNVLHSPCLG